MVVLWLIEARRLSICNVLEWVTDKFSQPGNEPSIFDKALPKRIFGFLDR